MRYHWDISDTSYEKGILVVIHQMGILVYWVNMSVYIYIPIKMDDCDNYYHMNKIYNILWSIIIYHLWWWQSMIIIQYIYSYYHCVDPQTSSSPACNMPCRWRVLCPSAAKIYAIIRQSPNWQNSIQLQQLRTLLKRWKETNDWKWLD